METEDRMIRAIEHQSKPVRPGYDDLIARFPLRPLHTEADYDNALNAAQSLVGSVGLNEDEADYLDVLTDIIQKYEAMHHAIHRRGKPLETLKRMLNERGMSGSDLGRLLRNRPLGAAILRGERQSTDLFIG
jgi:antitoxin component HigA of HigAB toxin-antitoxin module